MPAFMKLLESRNEDFIQNFSTESALGMVETLWGIKHGKDPRKNCVLISFDPPVGHPPIVFNWSESDVWYFRSPPMEGDLMAQIDMLLNQSIYQRIIFLEREAPPHMRKIQRFIRHFKKHVSRRKTADELPEFILAEYSGPLNPVNFTVLREAHDTLLSQ